MPLPARQTNSVATVTVFRPASIASAIKRTDRPRRPRCRRRVAGPLATEGFFIHPDCRCRLPPTRDRSVRLSLGFHLAPRVSQSNDAIHDQASGLAIGIDNEVSDAFKLDSITNLSLGQSGFHKRSANRQ